jgi:hypothetical protein
MTAFPSWFLVRDATPEETAMLGAITRGNSHQITYVDDGIEIRVALPLKPGALKFARGFLEQLLRDTGNG